MGGQIFSSFPDYGKAPKEYIASLIEFIAQYPEHIIRALGDPHKGIAVHQSFLPTKPEIKAFADHLIGAQTKADEYTQLDRRKRYSQMTALPRYRTPFRPFPALWAAFADEPAIIKLLDEAASFAFLDDAGRTLAMRGKAAAREIIDPQPDPRLNAMRDEAAPDLPPRGNHAEETAESLDRATQ